MQKYLLKLIILILLIFLIASCGTQPELRTSIPVVTATRQPATITPTAEPTARSFTTCQEAFDQQLPPDFLTEGSIIFRGKCGGKEGWHKLSAKTHQVEPFLDGILTQPDSSFRVSKDHQWLLIEKNSYDVNGQYKGTLLITGESDTSILEYPTQRGWSYLDDWYNNSQIGVYSWLEGFVISLLDPFTGKVSKFAYYEKDSDPYYFHSWGDLNPTMTQAVYGTRWEIASYPTNYLLKDLKTGQTLWQIQAETGKCCASDPVWSPNGKYFAFAIWRQQDVDFKMIAVDPSGKETIANELFPISDQLSFPNMVYPTWSSTGKYVSFWSKIDNENQLVLWMPETNQVLYPGIQSTSDFHLPLFSLDDQRFIIHSTNQAGQAGNLLVDLSSGKISRLDFDLWVIAWLKTNVEMTKPAQDPFPLAPQKNTSVKQILPKEQTSSFKQFTGSLIFSRERSLYALTQANAEHKLAETELAYVSPNQKTLFYWDEDANRIRHYWLYQENGPAKEVITDKIHSEYAHDEVDGWHNDHELWVKTRDRAGPLFDPFKNEFRSPPEFKQPDGYPEAQRCWVYCRSAGNWPAWLYQNYDKSFQRHIYIAASELMMQDQAGKVLWKYDNHLVGFNMPKWSPDDQKMAVPLPKDSAGEHYEIFTVDRDGHETQLTNYAAAYPTMTISGFAWSPDGRRIAFWGDTHSQENIAQQHPYRLFVLDIITRQTTDYSVTSGYAIRYQNDPHPLIWSPDGRQMAVNRTMDGVRQILILDFAAKTVTSVGEGKLIGWMTNK